MEGEARTMIGPHCIQRESLLLLLGMMRSWVVGSCVPFPSPHWAKLL